ncbi:MAG TPA: hypothetical protein VNS34_08245 [Rhizobiaceae bacterium]|nr:hypothetical protein [Rhizobiaceae bacterium]
MASIRINERLKGYYRYPGRAYADLGFLAVPDVADAPALARSPCSSDRLRSSPPHEL